MTYVFSSVQTGLSPLWAVLFGLAVAVYGYLLGSISSARIIAKAKGVDITKLGSHNPGGTNVWRNLGWKAGLTCMLSDMVKGFLAAFVPLLLVTLIPAIREGAAFGLLEFGGHQHTTIFACIGGVAACLGHSWPAYYGFKGGKNVMVSCGFVLAVSPQLMLFGLLCFLLALFISRRVAVGSLTAAAAAIIGGLVPVFLTAFHVDPGYQFTGMIFGTQEGMYFLFDWLSYLTILLSSLLIVVRHHSNIEQMAEHKTKKDF